MSRIIEATFQGILQRLLTQSIMILESPSTISFEYWCKRAACKPARRAKASAHRTLDFPQKFEDASRGFPSELRRMKPVVAVASDLTEPSKFNLIKSEGGLFHVMILLALEGLDLYKN